MKVEAAGTARSRTPFTMKQPYSRIRPARACGHLTKEKRDYCRICSPRNRVRSRCVICGSEMSLRRSEVGKKSTCSPDCASAYKSARQIGEKSHLWKGGRTEKNRRIRNSRQATAWRSAVMQRDNFTCSVCGARGGKLSVDHVLPWSTFPELRFDVRNGQTVCRTCHGALPTTGHRVKRVDQLVANSSMSGEVNPRIYLAMLWLLNPTYYATPAKRLVDVVTTHHR